MRSLPFVLVVGLVGCDDDHHFRRAEANEILFGVEQRADAAGVQVTGGYEFLGLAKRGGRGARVFRDGDGDGRCYLERLESRLGKPNVENGVAVFSGAKLPPSGVQILANQPDPKLNAQGWSTGDTLLFETSGFAMPYVSSFRMKVPRTELEGIGVAPTELRADTDLVTTWTPPVDGDASRVLVALRIDGAEVRCFDDVASGKVVIPAKWLTELYATVADGGKPTTVRLTVASHRQVTVFAEGDWIAYVVATTVFRDEALPSR